VYSKEAAAGYQVAFYRAPAVEQNKEGAGAEPGGDLDHR